MRRIEANIAIVLGLALSTLALLGQKNSEFAQQLGQTTTLPSTGWYPVLGVLAIIVLNGVFVAGEVAIELLRPVHVRFAKEHEPTQVERLQGILDRKSKYVAACTLASHFCRVAMVLVGLFLAPGVAGWLGEQLGRPDDPAIFVWSLVIVAIPIALLNLMFELVPKSYASLQPHRVALRLYRIIKLTSAVLSPPASLLSSIAGLLTARFGGRASFTMANQAEEEIKNLVESAQETGEIEVDEKELLHSVFEFSDTVAREVMTPRVDLESMSVTSDPMEIVDLIKKTGKSRIPLYEETDDQIVGIVHAKDLLMAVLKSEKANLRKIMRPPMFVTEGKALNELLREMRQSRSEMAIVQDEFGGTAGVVTTEDIVEELVGEIVDEYDFEEPEIVKLDNDTFLVHGKVHVDDVNDAIGCDLGNDEFDTIGGFVFGLFGRQPKRDEKIESDELRFTITDSDGRRIKRMKVEKIPVALEASLFEGE
ncbi:MAG: HlyC/CorC family transporter [Chlorobia bacterium]|nr:HlyC/CorC family transporter [Fimbriimonadaceae bacterium]